MRRLSAIAVVIVTGTMLFWLVAVLRGQFPRPILRAAACRHDAAALPADRARREQALTLARAINTAQGRIAQQTRQYQPLEQLIGLPATPIGFQLRLYTNGAGYIFSLKDERDPCHYGVFSDQQGRLYEMTPEVPLIAS